MGLRSYIFKRIVYSFILIFFVISLNFMIFMLMPGDPLAAFISPDLRPEQAEALHEMWALSEPMHVQYVNYLKNTLTFQFGISFESRKPITEEVGMYLGNTLFLLGTTEILAVSIGVILGVVTASKRGSALDSGTVTTSLIFYALPSFWMGMLFLSILGAGLGLFPLRGSYPLEWARAPPHPFDVSSTSSAQNLVVGLNLYPNDLATFIFGRLHHLFLPCFTLVLFLFGGWLLLTRATMLECITEDYVTTARAKGLKERDVLYKHALKNASLPIITSAAIAFAGIISGAILTETVFSWHGLGLWIWRSITVRDLPALQAIFYILALLTIIANFLADLSYGIIDPRIKYG